MLTMNYQGLQEKYCKPRKKKIKKNVSSGSNKKKKNSTYQEQLKDKRWRTKRLSLLRKLGSKCCLCGNSHDLNVHHLSYKEGKQAWEYKDTNFVILCKDCHEKVHKDPNHELYPKFL